MISFDSLKQRLDKMVQTDLFTKESSIEYLFERNGVEVWVQRDDLLDPLVSGNKIFKLAPNITEAISLGHQHITTFGGAYSNHIAATAAYCHALGLGCTGIIRGERPSQLNPTLATAEGQGMQLVFVSREEYRLKTQAGTAPTWLSNGKSTYVIPEGGANALGIAGAMKMVRESSGSFSHLIAPIGTGTTIAGIALAAKEDQTITGVLVHKHSRIMEELARQFPKFSKAISRVKIVEDAHCGGYAKWTNELISTMRAVYQKTGLKLDPIYTGKAMAGLLKEIDERRIPPGSKALFFHTGGMQGLPGFEQRFGFEVFPAIGSNQT